MIQLVKTKVLRGFIANAVVPERVIPPLRLEQNPSDAACRAITQAGGYSAQAAVTVAGM